MGNNISQLKVNFEDIQHGILNKHDYVLINTMNEQFQSCLIANTIHLKQEETTINELLYNNKSKHIIIYGKNDCDETIFEKMKQLKKLGFSNTYVYCGGMFEWLLLQDIYGEENFPTTARELDILKYKPNKKMNIQLLTY